MRREIPLIITTIAGLVFAISYFIPHMPFGSAETIFGDWVTIVQAFAIWLGVLNLLWVTGEKVHRRRPEWKYGVIVIITLVATIAVGLYDGFAGLNANPPTSYRDAGTAFDWIFSYLYDPLSSTMFAMLAFYISSAAYRAFRARNLEATLLLIAAFFMMGGRVPLLDLLISPFTDTLVFSKLSSWIMNFPVAGGQRAIAIGIALGIMSSSLRVILGIERSHIGGGE
jgi:hypothetical protein